MDLRRGGPGTEELWRNGSDDLELSAARHDADAPWWPGDAEPGELPSDDELTALALSSDPDQPLDPDAAPLRWTGRPDASMLPGWYMPPALARLGGWRSRVVLALVLGFLLIEAAGLCFTYGPIVP
jgi:hypothetical protein